jgi:uncharacterized protein YodC (DUF2158 family)
VDWKEGDVVRLKSSGSSRSSEPNMTVMNVSDDGIRCWWFDKSKLREKVFPDWALVEAKSATSVINIDLGDGPP